MSFQLYPTSATCSPPPHYPALQAPLPPVRLLSHSNTQKRKRSSPSPPPLEPHNPEVKTECEDQLHLTVGPPSTKPHQLGIAGEDQPHLTTGPKGSPTHNRTYTEWSGRGRSPFKTPATGAIDGLRTSARVLEAFYREINLQQAQLETLIEEKTARLKGIHQTKSNMTPAGPHDFASTPHFPPPPETSLTRSLSPSKYKAKLATGTPRIIERSFAGYKGKIPESVRDTKTRLQRRLEHGCMPEQFRIEMEQLHPNIDFDNYADGSAFTYMEDRPAEDVAKLWERAKEICDQAHFCQQQWCDENAWSMHVVRPALNWEPGRTPFFRTEHIQTQAISNSYLQDPNDKSMPIKKADFALAFSPLHPEVEQKYKSMADRYGARPPLSQMNDDYTQSLALIAGAKVKGRGGNELEGNGQCFQWLGAGVQKLRSMIDTNETTYPLLGWVIVGSKWELYMAVGLGNRPKDEISVFGPLEGCAVDTRSPFGAFKLLRLMERVKDWARHVYWPWYCRVVVIEPLAFPVEDDEDDDTML